MNMALDPANLEYPLRRYGMDHDRYAWSMLSTRKPVAWPGGKKLALWVNVSLQHFPMNPAGKPVKLPGSMTMPYPDLRHFTLRDYGNRVGIYRFFDAFTRYGIQPTFAINAQLAERYPALLHDVLSPRRRGARPFVEHGHAARRRPGRNAGGRHHPAFARPAACDQRPAGARLAEPGPAGEPEHARAAQVAWHRVLLRLGQRRHALPFHTRHGDLWAMPLPTEIEDRFVIMDNQHAEASWAQQVIDAGQMLLAEARQEGGRILALSIHPWVLGQPHRIKHLETVLEALSAEPAVWCAGAGEILDSFVSQA
jgi:allantoinase